MDYEIKRLLKLSSIPGFKLLAKEQEKLDNWKAQQVPVKPKRTYKKKTYKKNTNQVKPDEKETGELEES